MYVIWSGYEALQEWNVNISASQCIIPYTHLGFRTPWGWVARWLSG